MEERFKEVYTELNMVWPCFAFNLMKMTLS